MFFNKYLYLVSVFICLILISGLVNPDDFYSPQPHESGIYLDAQATATYVSQPDDLDNYNQNPWVMFRGNASRCGYIQGVNAPETNNTLWTFNTTNSNTGNAVYSSAAIANGKVYIGSGEGKLYCLDLATGAHNWNYSTGPWHGQSCSPAVYNDKVFIGNDFAPQMWCINATTGLKIWNFSTGGGMMVGIYSSPAAVGGRVYFGSDNNKLFCLPENDPNGDGSLKMSEIIWQFDTPDNVWSSPTVVDNRVYVGCGDGNSVGSNRLYCLYANNGTIAWTYPSVGNVEDIISAPAVVNGRVYFGAKDNNIYALYANNGTKIWNYPTGDKIWCSPAVAYGRVFIGSNDNKLYCLNANTGTKIWDYTTGDNIWASPSVADNKVYIGSCDGSVYCFNATANTAQKLWELKITSKQYGICSSASIADGKLVVGGANGGAGDISKIYCFADIDITPPTIIKTYPADQAIEIPTTVTIAINFSEPMDDSTITTSNILLKDSLDNSVTGTVNYISTTDSATFTPTNLLTRGETYTVTVVSAVKDKADLGLDGNKNGNSEGSPFDDYSWQFTTTENIPPGLTNAILTPTIGNSDTVFEYGIVYTDLDNDTPSQSPGFIKLHIDGEQSGNTMSLDNSAPQIWCDGNYSNGERFVYATQIPTYGMHKYQFNCSDGIDNISTVIFINPLVWHPQELIELDELTATEDIVLVLDMRTKIYDEDSDKNGFVLTENSSYATVSGLNLTFNYPNSFNYPSGRTFELVNISVEDPERDHEIYKELKVNVIAVNDAPLVSGIPNLYITENNDFKLNVTPFLSDEDNELSDLQITTNSSFATVEDQELTFYYPVNCGLKIDPVKITVSDGKLSSHQNITIFIVADDAPFVLLPIPDQTAIEDVDMVLDMEDFTIPIGDTDVNNFNFEINSSYGIVTGSSLIFNYPNSFNYPSGQDYEIVQVNVSYQDYTDTQTFLIDIIQINDAPLISVLSAPSMGVENISVEFKVKYFDQDGGESPLVEILIDEIPTSMNYISGDIHGSRGTYTIELVLSVGEHDYYFRANDLQNESNSVTMTNPYHIDIIDESDTDMDSDGDLMPDVWELKYGLDPFDPDDAYDDPDGDNYTNLEEFLGVDAEPGGKDSTDPWDPYDIPVEVDDDDKGSKERTDDSAVFVWLAVIIIVIIVVVILVVFFVLYRKPKEMIGPQGSTPPYCPEREEPLLTMPHPPPEDAPPVPPDAFPKPRPQIEWDEENTF